MRASSGCNPHSREGCPVHLPQLPRNALHQPAYNLIARPGSADYQNSTAWVLETLAATMQVPELTNRRAAYASACNHGFRPDTIHIAYSRHLLGGLFSANTIFTDHSVGTRLSGEYPVVTVRSILRYVQEQGHVLHEQEWRNGQARSIPGPA